MNTRRIKVELYKMRLVEPSEEWLTKSRAKLMARIRFASFGVRKMRRVSWFAAYGIVLKEYVFHPWRVGQSVGAIGIIVLMALGTTVGFAGVAKGSVPGDTLHAVKILQEQLDVAFTFSEEQKATKQVTRAQERLKEVHQVIARKNSESEIVQTAVSNFKKQVALTHVQLEKIQTRKAAKNVAQAAKVIQEKTDAFAGALVGITETLPQAGQEAVANEVAQALAVVENVNLKSFEVIVEKIEENTEVQEVITEGEAAKKLKQEILKADDKLDDKLNEKIAGEQRGVAVLADIEKTALEQSCDSLRQKIEAKNVPIVHSVGEEALILTPEIQQLLDAKISLQRAKDCLKKKNLKEAVARVVDSNELAGGVAAPELGNAEGAKGKEKSLTEERAGNALEKKTDTLGTKNTPTQ